MDSKNRCYAYLSTILFSDPETFHQLKPKFRKLMRDFLGYLEDGMDENFTADMTISKAKALVEGVSNE